MKNLLYSLIVLCLFACETDSLLPCDGDGPVGKTCREYRYQNGVAQGFVEFEYEADTTIISNIINQRSEIVKTVIERFENGKITLIAEQFPDSESRVQTWHYNSSDSLFEIHFGSNDSLLQIIYEGGKRYRENYFHEGELNRWVQYRYYQDDGKLYRKSFYNAADSLIRYENFQYFSTGQTRISRYKSDHQLIERTVFSFSQLGLITSIETLDASGLVTRDENYIYDVAGKLIERNALVDEVSSKSVFLYY